MKKIFLLFLIYLFLIVAAGNTVWAKNVQNFQGILESKSVFIGVKNSKCETFSYLVKPGDTFFELFGENWEAVARLNRISEKGLLAGTEILVPCKSEIVLESPLPFHLDYCEDKSILIDLSEQALGIYEKGRLIEWFPVSTGKERLETPIGDFRIRRKDKDHVSSSYPKPNGGAPMDYGLDFRAGIYWIHAGKLPGFPASHGCVRLAEKDAKRLYRWAEIGTFVKIIQ